MFIKRFILTYLIDSVNTEEMRISSEQLVLADTVDNGPLLEALNMHVSIGNFFSTRSTLVQMLQEAAEGSDSGNYVLVVADQVDLQHVGNVSSLSMIHLLDELEPNVNHLFHSFVHDFKQTYIQQLANGKRVTKSISFGFQGPAATCLGSFSGTILQSRKKCAKTTK